MVKVQVEPGYGWTVREPYRRYAVRTGEGVLIGVEFGPDKKFYWTRVKHCVHSGFGRRLPCTICRVPWIVGEVRPSQAQDWLERELGQTYDVFTATMLAHDLNTWAEEFQKTYGQRKTFVRSKSDIKLKKASKKLAKQFSIELPMKPRKKKAKDRQATRNSQPQLVLNRRK